MRVGDQLLLSLITNNPPVKLSKIMALVCDYVDPEDKYPINRLLGYLLTDTIKIRRPPGCIQMIYHNEPYWRDGWNNLYSNRTCRKVGIFYPQLKRVVFD